LKREIVVDGKPHRIELNKCDVGAPFSVRVDDKPREVELEREPDYKAPFYIKVDGKQYSVELGRMEREAPFSIKINNIPFTAQFRAEVRGVLARVPETAVSVLVQKPSRRVVEEGVVVAPMAGKIVSVRVKKGDSVKAGDVVCTLEAMKMENEIVSPKGGLIEEVRVSEGVAVNEGDVLIIIKQYSC